MVVKSITRHVLKAFVFLLVLLWHGSALSQYTIFRYSKIHNSRSNDTLDVPLVNPSLNFVGNRFLDYSIIDVSRRGDTAVTTIKYKITEPIPALIADGWGHEVVISPDDTIDIFCQKYPPGQNFLMDSIPSPWIHKMRYRGKNSGNYMLFDSIAYVGEAIHMDHLHFNRKSSPDSFFLKANIQYRKRMEYLKGFSQNHKVANAVVYYAMNEIKYAYLSKLLEILQFLGPNIDRGLLDSLQGTNSEDDYLFERSFLYPAFVELYKTSFDSLGRKRTVISNTLLSEFSSYSQTKDPRIRNYLLTNLFKKFVRYRNDEYDSLATIYRTICSNEGYIGFIDSLIVSVRNVNMQQALHEQLLSSENAEFTLKMLLKMNPVVIDCWASWCKPCLQERGAFEKFARQYRDRIDFISISLDRNRSSWLKKQEEFKNSDIPEYWVKGNFSSDFSIFFKISSLPRYIFLDHSGNVIQFSAARPSDAVTYTEQLSELIKADNGSK